MTTHQSSIFQAIAGMVGRVAAAHRRRQTSRILGGLPDHIRKDIGYGGRDASAPQNHRFDLAVLTGFWPSGKGRTKAAMTS